MAIGETILGSVLAVVLDKLASQDVLNFFKCSKIEQSLVNNLKTLMLAAEQLLLDAEEKQLTNRAVKLWLDELKHWFYRAEEVVDEIATEALRSSVQPPLEDHAPGTMLRNLVPGSSTSVSSFEKIMNVKMREIVSMLESMLNQKDALGLRQVSVSKSSQRVPTTCLLDDSSVYGRDREREEIVGVLRSNGAQRNKIDVVAIVGMGGLGKTTLAKLVYNDESLKERFDLKAWVYVSDEFDIYQVTKSILESVTRQSYSGSLDLNFLQVELSGELRGKRFLLVLDDVWNENYEQWECLRIPFSFGADGSKIFVTTRNHEVASIMRTKPTFSLKPLAEDDGWSLFSRHAFEVDYSGTNPSLELVGRKLVHKCRGLPLAIKALGGLLRSKQEPREWFAILQSNLWDIPIDKSNFVPALRLSYVHLPSHLKRCFSYCSIFPKDYPINMTKLVLLWMAEDFIQPNGSTRRLEDIGNDYINQLLAKCFFERRGASSIVMHDLLHDLAQAVSGEFCAKLEHGNVSDSCISRNARHSSYVRGRYDGITIIEAMHKAKYLRTFLPLQTWVSQSVHREAYVPDIYSLRSDSPLPEILPSYCFLSNAIPIAMVPQFSCLRVLSLSKYRNLRLCESIINLKQLRYLDLCDSGIIELPGEVCSLVNLQTLLLSGCQSLKRLPEGMWRLLSLRHLDLSDTSSLVEMPKRIIDLKGLQTLSVYVVAKHSGPTIEELSELPHIRGELSLRFLQNVTVAAASEVNLSSREFLDKLILIFDAEDKSDSEKERLVLESLKPPNNLRHLAIRHYSGTRFPSWLKLDTHFSYGSLTYLWLDNCMYCYSLPPLGQLQSLEKLIISRMEFLQVVGSEFYGHHSTFSSPFPSLKILAFNDMKGWDEWLDYEGSTLPFTRLRNLLLFKCPKLKGNLPLHIPSLENFYVDKCEQSTISLPQLASIRSLILRFCPKMVIGSAFHLTSITIMSLKGFVHLENFPPNLVKLSLLKYLRISGWENLKTLAEVQLPPKLQELYIDECEILKSLPKAIVHLTQLQRITLDNCARLISASTETFPMSLQKLHVNDCESWRLAISMESMHHFTSLERLWISGIGGPLVSFPLGLFPKLCSLKFDECFDLENLYLPEESGNNLLFLRELTIISCPKLEFIGQETGRGQGALRFAANLECFRVIDCYEVKTLLIKNLPSKLVSLSIAVSNISLSDWATMSFVGFSCLRELYISSSHAEFFPKINFLPMSLTKLYIQRFQRLKFLDGKGLQSLTSLEELTLKDCPKLACLPEEKLPPSLGCLQIINCPLLEERCQMEKGQDWSKIDHLPCVKITIIHGSLEMKSILLTPMLEGRMPWRNP